MEHLKPYVHIVSELAEESVVEQSAAKWQVGLFIQHAAWLILQ